MVIWILSLNKKNYTLKISAGDHPLKKIPSDHGDMVTRYAGAGRVQIKEFIADFQTEFHGESEKNSVFVHEDVRGS